MAIRTMMLAVTAVAGIALSGGTALAQDAISAPATKSIGAAKPKIEPALIVLNSKGASLAGGKLVLSGVSPNSIMFADRPVRAAGHVLTAHLLEEWAVGSDSFAKDPPNATVSVLSKDGSSVLDAVVTLKTPKLEGETLTFDVDVLEGSLDGGDGPASTFIDIIGMPFTPLSFAGAARRAAYRGAWYAGAAAGAAAVAAPYYYHPYYHPYVRPACGFYPYPPCY
ncbi:hypothetical protein MesoLjLc_36910 [Mesorhizobium sp. L-8-10]|uniref:hypothetical protein n=1 Tax=unclassified Mesorhizobium TaxID=325217 RepID=UPI00193675C6|nr:hypothetical protein MesoLjLb_38080 [Mesorhizobium sp. L-8-3]BCH31761.1 hypothetical protein MesoLjLc_36910 [Mesorhizobium sp. L-8-10]